MQAGSTLHPHLPRLPRQKGFTFIAVLAAMMILALGTQGVMTYVSQQAQREREAELLRTGDAYVKAIGAYYEATPGSVKQWPRKLEDLLEDRRLVVTRRHLRETYPDPITRSSNWGIVAAPGGGIAGVYSPSTATPIRTGSIELGSLTLPPVRRYADWLFVYAPPAQPPATSGAQNKTGQR